MTQVEEAPKRGRGRPPSPTKGKEANFATRISVETRAALEREAALSKESISQVAERWLLAGSELQAGLKVADVIRAMASVARDVEVEYGDPRESAFARDALIGAWEAIGQGALPYTPATKSEKEAATAKAAAEDLCARLFETLWLAPDGELKRVAEHRPNLSGGVLGYFDSDPNGVSLMDRLQSAAGGALDPALSRALRYGLIEIETKLADTEAALAEPIRSTKAALQRYEFLNVIAAIERAKAVRAGRALAGPLATRLAQLDLVRTLASDPAPSGQTDPSAR